MDLKATRYETGDGVAVVTLDRPDRLNAWTSRMEQEVRWSFSEADNDPDVRVIVLTGAGRGFCAGADMAALKRLEDGARYGEVLGRDGGEGSEVPEVSPGAGVRPDFEHGYSWLLGLRKPVIAAVNGAVAGVGFVLMCHTDIRFAAEGAKLTTSFARLGLPAEHAVSWLLSRLVGAGRAADLLLSARVVRAEEAFTMGLVNRVFPAETLLDETMAYAKAMAAECSPASLLTMKRQLWTGLLDSLDSAASDAEALLLKMLAEDDFKEGVRAYREKRPPAFTPLPRQG
ncbi:MAG TPA: enoyl-CoA hydratase-related protein [Acidimicrobiales bacterium]|nr:enoyl-CoA hydratase-related protein [Acidimicrobiales bacterium]